MCLLCSLCVFVGVVFFSGLFLFSCVCIGWVGLGWGCFLSGDFFFVCLYWVGLGLGLGWLMGVRGNFKEVPAQFAVFTNHRNKGLISVNRRTSLLSHLQYPVPIKVVYKGFNALNARKAKKFGVGPKPIATREHREQIYRRFPAWILT